MIIEIFYEKYLVQYIDVITASCPPKGIAETLYKSTRSGGRVEAQIFMKPEILLSICELLCFCVLHHPSRIKYRSCIYCIFNGVFFFLRRKEESSFHSFELTVKECVFFPPGTTSLSIV